MTRLTPKSGGIQSLLKQKLSTLLHQVNTPKVGSLHCLLSTFNGTVLLLNLVQVHVYASFFSFLEASYQSIHLWNHQQNPDIFSRPPTTRYLSRSSVWSRFRNSSPEARGNVEDPWCQQLCLQHHEQHNLWRC